ncbi:MAG: DUF1553 domain-containing protein [Candidatus Hydrogenedentes bacterium]|nr:DUF1553 domain-containing protein [Candidatus Hydrogenedentota bacterium]
MRTRTKPGRLQICGIALVALFISANTFADPSPVRFNRDVLPIFVKNCYACHGADAAKRKASFRLDDDSTLFAALPSGNIAIVPGDRSMSALWRRVATKDSSDVMPPPDSGKSLTPDEIETIGRWIDSGAPYEAHWAFQPLRRATPPAVENASWPRNTIDRFVLARLEKAGLPPSPEADKRTLIRRLSFDLLGLPPTPEEIDAFNGDASPDAYEKLVDRMLASPRYGERWGRHWLDVVHYGDTHGYDKDKRRPNAWPYRDYVIQSLNEDKAYGQFVREQIAGDVLSPNDPNATIATGFIAAGPWDFVGHAELREGTVDKNITRVLDRDDMVVNTMTTFASMTVHCARCHDHKFDPISQREYYSLQAVFAGVDRAERPVDKDPAVFAQRIALSSERRTLTARSKEIDAAYAAIKDDTLTGIDQKLADARAQLKKAGESPTNGYHSAIESKRDVTKWVQVDLGSPQPIESIILVPALPTDFPDTPGFGFPVRFKIETSDDETFQTAHGVVDETQADFPNNADSPYSASNVGVTARYVRVTATKLWERTSDFAFALGELRVQSNGNDLALGATVTAQDSIEDGRWSKKALVDGYSSRRAIVKSAGATEDIQMLEAQVKQFESKREERINALVDPALRQERETARARLSEIATTLDALPAPQMTFAAANDFKSEGSFTPAGKPRSIHLLIRGDVKTPGDEVSPGALAIEKELTASFALSNPDDEGQRRAALAEWLADPKNTLTWRSIVNRVWHYHFGRGIVETPSDFGHMGAYPTHPELLDWLATEFLANGQSLKWLHKQIVTSATYRQSSNDTEAGMRIDAGNQLLWRMNRRQLDAESLRDSVLAVSGKLDLTMGGPGYDLFVFKDDHSPGYFYDKFDVADPKSFRRSIYRFVVRSVPDPFMETLDCADPSQNVPARNNTITALQALSVFNNPFVVKQSEYFAERVQPSAPSLDTQIIEAFHLALGRSPVDDEIHALRELAEKDGLASACRVLFNSNEFVFID